MNPLTQPRPPPRTLLVVDPNPTSVARLRKDLGRAGFATVQASSALDATRRLDDHDVAAVVVEHTLSGELLEVVRGVAGVQPSVVVRGPTEEASVSAAYAAGADDYVGLDAPEVELAGRVRGLLRNRDYIDRISQRERDANAMLELTQALASSLDFSEILHTVVRRIADVVNVDRVSIVISPDVETPDVGFVVATSDDREIENLPVDLEKYPEIQTVLQTGEPLTIADASTHPVLAGVRDTVPADVVAGLTLLPIVWQGQAVGVLFLRSARRGSLSSRDIAFCRIIANATAIALRNARVMQSLRDQTQKVNFARFEAERRLRALRRYANLFTSAADGLAALDTSGRMLFANPRAYEIVGATQERDRGLSLRELIAPEDRHRVIDVWRRVQAGDYPRAVDLRLLRPGEDGRSRIVSCSFSELTESEGAVLVSFRDVTADRRTAAELSKTKEFLESLIHASVDGIIAADMRGQILLFNQGAERIYGCDQASVVGKMHVTRLYPEGRAQEVMRLLRAPTHGGEGRLESIRFDALDRDGRLVPITLSAAMIFDENGRPSATVGIFTDLREKLRVEQRLARAQEKLAVSEKQALIAELAGTAAHELNQPLQSVSGYAEILVRKLPEGGPDRRAAEVILREAQRMADIVRKIGRITRYETKSYVGTQKILDLDRSALRSDELDLPPADEVAPRSLEDSE